jgi:hypothetical protein
MGRPKGSRNKPKLQLEKQATANDPKPSPAERDRALRELVCALVAQGHSEQGIAVALRIDTEKLRALFPIELEHGATIHAAAVTAMLQAEARGGNVSAMRKLEDMAGVPPTSTPLPGAAPRLGKKESAQAKAPAAHLGTSWDFISGDTGDQ